MNTPKILIPTKIYQGEAILRNAIEDCPVCNGHTIQEWANPVLFPDAEYRGVEKCSGREYYLVPLADNTIIWRWDDESDHVYGQVHNGEVDWSLSDWIVRELLSN